MAKIKHKSEKSRVKISDINPLISPSEKESMSLTSNIKPPVIQQSVAFKDNRQRGGVRICSDLIKVAGALVVIGVAIVIWYQPPLMRSHFPYVSYQFQGALATDARLYRPLAMPTRYYIELPQTLSGRYHWFAIDQRREIATLTEAPKHHVFGRPVIRRGDTLGLDLEFRKLDGSEWQVHFFKNSIVFSNAMLCVRMDNNKRTPK